MSGGHDAPASEIVVKVDVRRVNDPAAHVAAVVRPVAPGATAEEVFPGLRDGASAGLVTVHFTRAVDAAARRACLSALTADPFISSVHEPKSRRPH
jgi:hypothetical protein